MELTQFYNELTERFSARYPALAEVAPLYLLALFTYEESVTALSFFSWGMLVNKDIVKNCLDKKHIGFEEISETDLPKISRLLINECIALARKSSKTLKRDFLLELAKKSPEVYPIHRKSGNGYLSAEEVQKIKPFKDELLFSLNYDLIPLEDYSEIALSMMGMEWLRNGAALTVSEELAKFMAKLSSPQPKQNVYSPTCGDGRLFLSLMNLYPNCQFDFFGNSSGDFTGFLCESNMFSHYLISPGDFFVTHDHPFENSTLEDHFGRSITGGADLAIAIVPFNTPLDTQLMDNDLFSRHFKENPKWKKEEFSLVKYITDNLTDKGKAVIVVTEDFLTSIQARNLRKQYLENDWIEKVINLPDDTFDQYEKRKTSIIVFNKNKKDKGSVIFDGWKEADKFVKTKVQTADLLKVSDFDLRVKLYASKSGQELINSIAQIESTVTLADLTEISFVGRNPKPRFGSISEQDEYNIQVVRVKDLSMNQSNFTLDLDKVEKYIVRFGLKETQIIDFPVVLVSLMGTKLHPTYFDYNGTPVVLGSDIVALKLKPGVNIDYLLTQLQSELVRLQIEVKSRGAVIKRIRREDLLGIQIPMPSKTEQDKQILETKAFLEEKASVKNKIEDVKRQIQQAEIDLIGNINHSLKNKLGKIRNDFETLILVLRQLETSGSVIIFNKPIFDDEDDSTSDTLETITQRLRQHISGASKVFNNALKLQKLTLNKSTIELIDFFEKRVKRRFADAAYAIEVEAPIDSKIYVQIDREAFNDVLENLIENSKVHGFLDSSIRYKINFVLSVTEVFDPENGVVTNYARIVYRDNGKGFPANFSFDEYIQYSNKAGDTQGTGIGGAFINRIIELHEGKFSPISLQSNTSPYSVELEILLPLEG